MKIHNLKCWPESFKPIVSGKKTFDIRFNDRGFKVRDQLILEEYDPAKKAYTGRRLKATISYILANTIDFGLSEGYACLSLVDVRGLRL